MGVFCFIVKIPSNFYFKMSKTNQTKSVSFFTTGAITVVSVTLVLILLGLTALVGITSKGLASVFKESLGITIEVAADTPDAEVAKMRKRLESNSYLKSVVYISKDEIKKDLVGKLGLDPEDVLGFDPSLSYFDVYVKSEFVNPEDMAKVKESLRTGDVIQNIIFSEDVIADANRTLSVVGSILLALTVVLVFISFTLIRSIIQLNIYSRRFTINTMQLVGATNAFIRRPFVWSMVWRGILAAILACLALTAIVYYGTSMFPEVVKIFTSYDLLLVYGVVFLSGVLISAVATVTAVNRYLRMSTNRLYRA